MATSARIQEYLLRFMDDRQEHSVSELKTFLQTTDANDFTEGQFSGSMNTLVRNGSVKKLERGIYSLNERNQFMKKCFVVSPIGDAGSDIRNNADKLFRYIIEPVCAECGFKAERVDQVNGAGSITQTIIDSLDSAELVIADITGKNPNVFYEMGYRKRTGKPLIHLKAKGEMIPFDVNSIRTFEYDLTDLDSVAEIKDRLTKTIRAMDFAVSEEESDESLESVPSGIEVSLLYQILDTLADIKAEIRNNNQETIKTVIQNAQPQISADAALQMQLMNSMMNNPRGFLELAKIAEQFPGGKKK